MSRQPRAAWFHQPCVAPFRYQPAGARPALVALLGVVATATLAACKPAPPDPERPPEPQAAHTELRDAMQAPVDKARAVEDELQKAAEARRAAIDAAGG